MNQLLKLELDYNNSNYNLVIIAYDDFYLPNESNTEFIISIDEQGTLDDNTNSYDSNQLINIYTNDIIIDMSQLFLNITHYNQQYQRYNIIVSDHTNTPIQNPEQLYYNKQNNSNLIITANGKGEEYFITIDSFIQNYGQQTLTKQFRVLELPTITEKQITLTNPLYFSNV